MKVVDCRQSDSKLDFESLGRTLRLLDGDEVRVGLGFVENWSSRNADGGDVVLLGGFSGLLRVPVSLSDVEGYVPGAEPPVGAVEPDERAYVLVIGEGDAAGRGTFAVSSAHFVGAAYEDGVLKIQTGALLMSIAPHREDRG